MKAGAITQFAKRNFTHFNAARLVEAADAYKKFVEDGGAMMVTLAGAMSTGEIGKSLAEMIRQEKVHAISCTGANLEEDVFNLVGHFDYEPLPDYRDLTPAEEEELRAKGLNRVTDTAIPDEEVVNPVTKAVFKEWEKADKAGEAHFPHEYLYRVLLSGALKKRYQADPKDSWLMAAAEKNLEIVVPGWEDSTLGNAFAACVIRGEIDNVTTCRSGIEYFIQLADWYEAIASSRDVGFFQIGGGIAGDMPICVVPMLRLELDKEKLPLWRYFCQITDAVESYGGYSGARPGEKITWGKLKEGDPMFEIRSDASIVAPLIFAMVLGQ